MRRSAQWTLILALAVAVAVFMAPGGIAHEGDNDDDDNGDENGECHGNDCDDDDGGDEAECPCQSEEFLVGTFGCAGGSPNLMFAGSSGVGTFMISGAPIADPNSCATLGGELESEAVDSGCTSAGLVVDPAVALTITCAGDRDDVVEAQGNLVTTLLTFMPSTPLVIQQDTHTLSSLARQSSQSRRR